MGYGARRTLVLLQLVLALAAGLAHAADTGCSQWVGRMTSVQGPAVEVRRAGDSRFLPVAMGDTLCPGDTIRVGSKSRADLALANQSVLRIDQDTELTLEAVREQSTALLDLIKGAIHFLSRTIRGLEVRTPYTIAGVRGTEFLIGVEQGRTSLTVYEGAVLAESPAGSITLQGGQSAVVEAGKPPVLRVLARPRDAVQWALYYPPVVYVAPGAADAALAENDPRRYTRNASRLLSVGRVAEANAELERALSLDPKSADALALQTIVLIVGNRKAEALVTAERSVQDNPDSATARIALSYARQAGFDLEAARRSLEEAVKLDPADALAWARLSELQMSLGYLDRSLQAARQAVAVDPGLSRTQTVLGFAHLAQVDTAQAKAAFEQAIALDQADPLPRLGLGLAVIRDGNLQDGGRQIEIAASLDPNNSLVRSYLGKTYFEEKRTGLDQREYATAKELDPKDPTPYFYDAIAKQTTNRPVEALRDYQKAIELNDNRAVYRSQLFLDSDLAARSAALARIYGDLGFQQRALAEGYNSVNIDPTNFSAHRFLADSYSVLPRHEIARVSELLQSQLLQPINITPIQPGSAEGNLFLISAQGPTNFSYSEFNPIFTRNRVAALGTGLLGENDTKSGDGVVSGIYDKLSFSAGATYFDTDGWRQNANQTDKIADVFAQYELSPSTSIQAEYRYRENNRGDTAQWFFRNDFFPGLSQDSNTSMGRLGFRQSFSPSSVVIGNFSYQSLNGTDQNQPDPNLGFRFKTDQDTYGSELQYLFRSQYVNVVTGAGYFNIDGKEKDNFALGPPPIFVIQDRVSLDFKHYNAYLYSYIKPVEGLTVTAAGSADFQNADNELIGEKSQFNPKFGVTWNPLPDTTLRAAAFRVLKRTLITDQTVEPTQVAGFNQFFDEVNATDYWVFGGAVDQKFSQKIYGGVGYTYRNLNVPFENFNATTAASSLDNANWRDKILRAYLFWTPHDWLSLTAEYMVERLDREENFALGAEKATTNYLPLGANFFHPSGLSLSLKATYIDQKGKFEHKDNVGVFENGGDNFWLVDAALRYRLPNRYGFLTVGVMNLFDRHFDYFDSDQDNLRFQPGRFGFVKLTLAFP